MRVVSIAMVVVGFGMVVGLPVLMLGWPAGFRWLNPAEHPPYERMIGAVYVSLGICLILGARDPLRNVIIIDFVILSSILHAVVMAYDAISQPHELMHLAGDIPLLIGLAALFAILHPRRASRRASLGRATNAAGGAPE